MAKKKLPKAKAKSLQVTLEALTDALRDLEVCLAIPRAGDGLELGGGAYDPPADPDGEAPKPRKRRNGKKNGDAKKTRG
jgi:hypothetical protein